ncbi:hypothetical protein BD770DRAFT_391403 [Pilaira anomala]|nr:hypothetical protein BD770DRAFT_391403 [Pilaira anomala]
MRSLNKSFTVEVKDFDLGPLYTTNEVGGGGGGGETAGRGQTGEGKTGQEGCSNKPDVKSGLEAPTRAEQTGRGATGGTTTKPFSSTLLQTSGSDVFMNKSFKISLFLQTCKEVFGLQAGAESMFKTRVQCVLLYTSNKGARGGKTKEIAVIT